MNFTFTHEREREPIRIGDFVRPVIGSPEERVRIFEVARLGEQRRFGGKFEEAAFDSAGKGYPFSLLELVGRKR